MRLRSFRKCPEVQYKNIKFQAATSELRSRLPTTAAVSDGWGLGPGWADKHPTILEARAQNLKGILYPLISEEQNCWTAVDQNCEELGFFNMFQYVQYVSICLIYKTFSASIISGPFLGRPRDLNQWFQLSLCIRAMSPPPERTVPVRCYYPNTNAIIYVSCWDLERSGTKTLYSSGDSHQGKKGFNGELPIYDFYHFPFGWVISQRLTPRWWIQQTQIALATRRRSCDWCWRRRSWRVSPCWYLRTSRTRQGERGAQKWLRHLCDCDQLSTYLCYIVYTAHMIYVCIAVSPLYIIYIIYTDI